MPMVAVEASIIAVVAPVVSQLVYGWGGVGWGGWGVKKRGIGIFFKLCFTENICKKYI